VSSVNSTLVVTASQATEASTPPRFDHLQASVRTAAIEDGFHEHDHHRSAFVIAAIGDAATIEYEAVQAARAADLPAPRSIPSGMLAMLAAELEHYYWPAKLVDAALPTYLAPIRQVFSSALLGSLPGSGDVTMTWD